MGRDDGEALMWLFLAIFGIAFLVTAYVFYLAITGLIALIIAYHRYKKYRREAEEDFDQVIAEACVDLPLDDMAYAVGIFGIEVPEGEFETVMDWMGGSAIGISEE